MSGTLFRGVFVHSVASSEVSPQLTKLQGEDLARIHEVDLWIYGSGTNQL